MTNDAWKLAIMVTIAPVGGLPLGALYRYAIAILLER